MDALAQAAVAPIQTGMVVGLGTGRAAARCVRALADRVAADRLTIRCVATSRATEDLAHDLELPVVDLNEVVRVDYLFDGADEVDASLCMIKGGGGAMTRERIVARACLASGGQTVYAVDRAKVVPGVPRARPIPVEVVPVARELVRRALGALGLSAVVRTDHGGPALRTDNAALILDATLPAPLPDRAAAQALARTLDALPGVIDHGLFIDECRRLLVEEADGRVTTIEAP